MSHLGSDVEFEKYKGILRLAKAVIENVPWLMRLVGIKKLQILSTRITSIFGAT
jgi:hypothetical protein